MVEENKNTGMTNAQGGAQRGAYDPRQRSGRGGRGGGQGRRGRSRRREEASEFESTIIDLARVTRVMAGGKRMSFRACVVVGDKKGRVGMGLEKGADVQLAVNKATEQAKKHLARIPLTQGTIPHTIQEKFKGVEVLLKPAKPGTGVIAGGAVRTVMELVGVTNVVSKLRGSNNKVNTVTAVLQALKGLHPRKTTTKQVTS